MSTFSTQEILKTFGAMIPKAEIISVTLDGHKNDYTSKLYVSVLVRLYDETEKSILDDVSNFGKYFKLLTYVGAAYKNTDSTLSADKVATISDTISSNDGFKSLFSIAPQGNVSQAFYRNEIFVTPKANDYVYTVNADGRQVVEKTIEVKFELWPDPTNLNIHLIPYLDVKSAMSETINYNWTDDRFIKSNTLYTESFLKDAKNISPKVIDNRLEKIPTAQDTRAEYLKEYPPMNVPKMTSKPRKYNEAGKYLSEIYMSANEKLESVFLFAFNRKQFILENAANVDYFKKNDTSTAIIKNVAIYRQRLDMEGSTYYTPVYEKIINSYEKDGIIIKASNNGNSIDTASGDRDVILFEVRDSSVKDKNYGIYGYRVDFEIYDPTLEQNNANKFDITGLGSGNRANSLLKLSYSFNNSKKINLRYGGNNLLVYDNSVDYFSGGYYDSNHDAGTINEIAEFSNLDTNSVRNISFDLYKANNDNVDSMIEKLLEPYIQELGINLQDFNLQKDYKFASFMKYSSNFTVFNLLNSINTQAQITLSKFPVIPKNLKEKPANPIDTLVSSMKINNVINTFGQKNTLSRQASLIANLDLDANLNSNFINTKALGKLLTVDDQSLLNKIEEYEKILYLSDNKSLDLCEMIPFSSTNTQVINDYLDKQDVPYGVKLTKIISFYAAAKNNLKVYTEVNNLLKNEDNFMKFFNYFKNYKIVKYLKGVKIIKDRQGNYIGMDLTWENFDPTTATFGVILCKIEDLNNYSNYNKEFFTANRYFTLSSVQNIVIQKLPNLHQFF